LQPFLADILFVVLAAAVAAGLVITFAERLLALMTTSRRRNVVGTLLLLTQLVAGFIIASVDFGQARKDGYFNAGDVDALRWLIPVAALGIALDVFMLLLSAHADKEKQELIAQAEFAKRERNFTTLVSGVFLNVVSRKRERLKSVKSRNQLLASLQPRLQMAALIQACWSLFDFLAPDDAPDDFRLRVAYYRRTPVGLEIAFAWNGVSSDCVPPRDAATMQRFRFDHPEGCLAVAAAQDGGIHRVADTEQAAAQRNHPFVFFDKNESQTLKSIAAMAVKLEGDPVPHGVLVVDTNLKGLFNGEDRRQGLVLEEIIENLAHRLHMEESLDALLGGP
jgi:hypothetical protein